MGGRRNALLRTTAVHTRHACAECRTIATLPVPGAHTGRISRSELVHLLDELASVDFMHVECSDVRHIDHDRFVTVELTVPAGTHRVTVNHCFGDHEAVPKVADDIEAVAERAAQNR